MPTVISQKRQAKCGILLCTMILLQLPPSPSLADSEEKRSSDGPELTVTALRADGKELRSGLAFLYDEKTIVCSYTDIKGAARIRIHAAEATTETSDLLAFSEAMDLAVVAAPEEVSAASTIVSSRTLDLRDRVTYWMDQSGKWRKASGTVHQIVDTGKGYNLILVESAGYSTRSSPLYDSKERIVGWIQGKRAIPMETIASLCEKRPGKMKLSEIGSFHNGWKFVKPPQTESRLLLSTAMFHVSGPASFPFRLELPEGLKPKVSANGNKFHVRYEHSGVCVEVRATPLQDNHFLAALSREENLIFTDFLRAEMIPYSVEALSGFRATYEDTDPLNPYALQVFYTSVSNHLYLISVGYPRPLQEEVSELIEKIFASFRF